MSERVIYYEDERQDDFAGTNINTQTVDESFPFVNKSLLWRAAAAVIYYVIALPVVWISIRVGNGTKVVNRKALKKVRKNGCFIYANHTHWTDSYLIHLLCAPKRTHIIAGPDAVSIRGLRNIVMMLGAIPIPTDRKSLPVFTNAVELRIAQGRAVAIYPEAHIWPYYTGIRMFRDTSFRYPAKLKAPVFAATVTYRKRRGLLSFLKTPARTVYVSDPISAPAEMSEREARVYLKERVYEFMCEASENNSMDYVKYEKNDEQPGTKISA